MSKRAEKILIPVIALLMGILLGCIILLISGKDISLLFSGLIKSATGFDLAKPTAGVNTRLIGEFFVYSTPIILTGLAVGFAYRCGMFNIGADGQVMMGALVSCIVAILVPMPTGIAVVVCLLAGGLAGALWAFIPGILKCKFNISEVVTGIMLNYTALFTGNFFYKSLPGSSPQRTVDVPVNASLGSSFLKSITSNSRFHYGIIVAIICCIVYWFIIEKTSFGYKLRATGFNKEGARYAGIKVNKSIISSIMISGFLAGLAGAVVLLGTFGYGRITTVSDGYGFDGIAVALVGGCNAIGIFLSGLLFGLLKASQNILQTGGIPKEIAEIIQASIVFFVAIQYVIKYVIDKTQKKKRSNNDKQAPQLVKEGGESK